MMTRVADASASSRLHPLSLLIAIAIMLVCTLYPPLMAAPDGKADHGLATAMFVAMSVAFVRGVGFVPRAFGAGCSRAGPAVLRWHWLAG